MAKRSAEGWVGAHEIGTYLYCPKRYGVASAEGLSLARPVSAANAQAMERGVRMHAAAETAMAARRPQRLWPVVVVVVVAAIVLGALSWGLL